MDPGDGGWAPDGPYLLTVRSARGIGMGRRGVRRGIFELGGVTVGQGKEAVDEAGGREGSHEMAHDVCICVNTRVGVSEGGGVDPVAALDTCNGGDAPADPDLSGVRAVRGIGMGRRSDGGGIFD